MNYKNDTIESKINNYKGENIADFLEEQSGYFMNKVLYSEGMEREHYKKQLKITSRAIQISVTN